MPRGFSFYSFSIHEKVFNMTLERADPGRGRPAPPPPLFFIFLFSISVKFQLFEGLGAGLPPPPVYRNPGSAHAFVSSMCSYFQED